MTIEIGQIILIATILIFGMYVFRLRSVLADRIILLLLAGGGLVLVIHPEFSMWAANQIGIGRGTDLLLYVFILFSLFYFVSLSAGSKRIERQLTNIVRELALQNPKQGKAEPYAEEGNGRSEIVQKSK